jgi:hypothetical protein
MYLAEAMKLLLNTRAIVSKFPWGRKKKSIRVFLAAFTPPKTPLWISSYPSSLPKGSPSVREGGWGMGKNIFGGRTQFRFLRPG